MNVKYNCFDTAGFNRELLSARLRLFELKDSHKVICQKLHDYVISPYINQIINDFYEYVLSNKEYRLFIPGEENLDGLKSTQKDYLHSLGKQFDTISYFESRLIVGVAHQRIGMSLSLYECAYRKLRDIISQYIPNEVNAETKDEMYSFLSKIVSLDMSLAIDSYTAQDTQLLHNSINSLEKKKAKLKIIAETDPLTQVFNRSKLISFIEDHPKHLEDEPFCVMMIDIDGLDSINEKLGHLAGDYVVKEVANRLKRKSSNVNLGRYTGDNFIMLLTNTNIEQAAEILEENEGLFAGKNIILGKHEQEISITQALIQVKPNETVSEIIRRVGRALTKVKQEKTKTRSH